MILLSVIIGVSVVAAAFVAVSHYLDTTEGGIFKKFSLLMVLPLLFLIPSSLSLEQNACEVVIDETTVSGNTTSYDYTTYCYDSPNGSRVFIRVYGVMIGIYFLFIVIIFFSELIKTLRKVVKKT